jgi:hypothetical protein
LRTSRGLVILGKDFGLSFATLGSERSPFKIILRISSNLSSNLCKLPVVAGQLSCERENGAKIPADSVVIIARQFVAERQVEVLKGQLTWE